MILHLYVECDWYRFGTPPPNPRQIRTVYRGLATRPAEVGRDPYIRACQRRGAKSIVTYLDGILT